MPQSEIIAMFVMLVVGHALADYPLQGDFLAKAKNKWAPIPGVPWGWAMFSHCTIHAGFVWFVTGLLTLFVVELIAHGVIDTFKCANKISFNLDQGAHIWLKWVYVILLSEGMIT